MITQHEQLFQLLYEQLRRQFDNYRVHVPFVGLQLQCHH